MRILSNLDTNIRTGCNQWQGEHICFFTLKVKQMQNEKLTER
jgi:hypothetical protein